MNRTIACALVAGTIAAPAMAGLSISHLWVQVDNTMFSPELDPLNGAAWAVGNWATFDLYLWVDGALVNGINLGSAPGEDHLGLLVGDAVFNTSGFVASDFETAAQFTFDASRYDTFVDLGSNNTDGLAPNELLGIGLNGLVPQAARLRGAWAQNPVNGGTAQDASQGIRILRLTIDADSIGTVPALGTGSLQIGLSSGTVVPYNIARLPAPGAAALMGIGGLVAARRRR